MKNRVRSPTMSGEHRMPSVVLDLPSHLLEAHIFHRLDLAALASLLLALQLQLEAETKTTTTTTTTTSENPEDKFDEKCSTNKPRINKITSLIEKIEFCYLKRAIARSSLRCVLQAISKVVGSRFYETMKDDGSKVIVRPGQGGEMGSEIEEPGHLSAIVGLVVECMLEVLGVDADSFPNLSKVLTSFLKHASENTTMIYLPQVKILLPDTTNQEIRLDQEDQISAYLTEVTREPRIAFLVSCLMKAILTENITEQISVRFLKSDIFERSVLPHNDGYGFTIVAEKVKKPNQKAKGPKMARSATTSEILAKTGPAIDLECEDEGAMMSDDPDSSSSNSDSNFEILSYTPMDDHKYFDDSISFTNPSLWSRLNAANPDIANKVFITNGVMGVMDVAVSIYHARQRDMDFRLSLYGLENFTRYEHWYRSFEVDWRALGYAIMSDDVSGQYRFDVEFSGADRGFGEKTRSIPAAAETKAKYARLLDEFHYSQAVTSFKFYDFVLSENKILDIFTSAPHCHVVETFEGDFGREDFIARRDEIRDAADVENY